jgi:hypothetical protein
MNDQTKITPKDIEMLRRVSRTYDIVKLGMRILQEEPLLLQAMADRHARIDRLLIEAGLSETQRLRIVGQVVRMAFEQIVALDFAHRRLWDDLLPDQGQSETQTEGI